jgi:glycosyltransferase 2 family protein
MTPRRQRWTSLLVAGAKLIMFALLCWFIYHTFVSGNQQLGAHSWHIEPAWLLLSGALFLLGLLPTALFWHQVLVRAAQPTGFGEAIRAHYISQLGKYVPGKWMVILMRRAALANPAVENTVVAASIFYETFTMLAVGAAYSALVLTIWHPDQRLMIALAVGSALLLGVPTIPAVFQWLMIVLRVGKLNPTAAAKIGRIGWRVIFVGWVTISLGWLLQGMSLWATLRGIGATSGGPLDNLSLNTTAAALAVVAGFLSQIPGGLGMREWVSAELVEPQFGTAVAIVSAIIFRLVQLVSEVVISIILYTAGSLWLRRPAAPTEQQWAVPDTGECLCPRHASLNSRLCGAERAQLAGETLIGDRAS